MDLNNRGHGVSLAILALLAFGLIALSIDRGVLLQVRPAVAKPNGTDTPTPNIPLNNKATSTPLPVFFATDTPQPILIDTEVPSVTPTPAPTVPTSTPTSTPAPNYGNGDPSALIDGHLDKGWLTSRIHGGFATIGFRGHALQSIRGFAVDCAATGGAPDTADLRRFEVLFSSTSADPGSFVSGVNETCAQRTGLQRFLLLSPVRARYVQLQLIDDYGDTKVAGVAEFETLARSVSAGRDVLAHARTAHLVARVRGAKPARSLGRVAQIVHGLGVQPPNEQTSKGKVRQPVFTRYALHTKVAQRACVQFVDGTMLYMSQDTDAVLRSPTLTFVQSGNAEQKLQPGTIHRISTAEATADAIGTDFVVDVHKTRMTLFVIEGAVLVHNKFGSQVVKTGQYTTVVKGHAPTAPARITSSTTPHPNAWSLTMMDPHLPMNVALDANGGHIVSSSP